jgi:hypothetical protein
VKDQGNGVRRAGSIEHVHDKVKDALGQHR